MDTAQLMQFVVTGLTTGSIYALVAIGFVTIYSVTGILNFAQGEYSMLGALICISCVNVGIPIYIAIPLAIVITALIGFLVERMTIFPSRNSSIITLIIMTIGVSILLKGLGLIIWGTYPLSLPPFSSMPPIQVFGAVIIPQSIWVFIILILQLALLYLFFEKTFLGSAVKASEVNPKAARLMGINTYSMSALAFTMSAAIGAVAGIMTAPITGAMYDMGFFLGLKGFVAMVLGGMNSIPGAVMGGFMLGILEALTGGFISTAYSDAVSFAILLLVLFLKPNGLFAKASGNRV
jgi:branched-chain amino acid transport system permease protein